MFLSSFPSGTLSRKSIGISSLTELLSLRLLETRHMESKKTPKEIFIIAGDHALFTVDGDGNCADGSQ